MSPTNRELPTFRFHAGTPVPAGSEKGANLPSLSQRAKQRSTAGAALSKSHSGGDTMLPPLVQPKKEVQSSGHQTGNSILSKSNQNKFIAPQPPPPKNDSSSATNLRLPDSALANHSPTPSDISSIRMTPRTPHADRNVFLEPFPLRSDWNSYKVLPDVGSSLDHNAASPSSALSLYAMSTHSLSPHPLDLSPAPSSFVSPRHSARSHLSFAAKKRALSISPMSADFDINIRTSPNSLVAYINNSRSSSANLSPFPGMLHGSIGHLGARQMTPTLVNHHQMQPREIKKELVDEEMRKMMELEMSSNEEGIQNSMSNQVVLYQEQIQRHEHLILKEESSQNNNENSKESQVQKQQQQYNPEQRMPPTARQPPLPRGMPYPSPRKQVPNSHNINSAYSESAGSEAGTGTESDGEEGLDEEEGEPPEDTDKVVVCRWTDCDNVFNDKEELVKHVEKAHIDQRKSDEFTCFWKECKREHKPFNARYKLLIHMRVHTGERPNKCTHAGCDKSFSRLENLKIHMRSHTGERPYKCTFTGCPKAFSNSSDRAKHQRTHLDTKPYACAIPGCTKRYTDPSSLRKHVKNHKQSEQQQRKKLKSNESGYSSEGLDSCLNITKIHPEQSGSPMTPMSMDSQGSLPATRSDFYPASMQFSLVQSTVSGKITYAAQKMGGGHMPMQSENPPQYHQHQAHHHQNQQQGQQMTNQQANLQQQQQQQVHMGNGQQGQFLQVQHSNQGMRNHLKPPSMFPSNHSSRSGTANGYSHQPSPVSMQSMGGSPMGGMPSSPYPLGHSPSFAMQQSPGLPMQHSPAMQMQQSPGLPMQHSPGLSMQHSPAQTMHPSPLPLSAQNSTLHPSPLPQMQQQQQQQQQRMDMTYPPMSNSQQNTSGFQHQLSPRPSFTNGIPQQSQLQHRAMGSFGHNPPSPHHGMVKMPFVSQSQPFGGNHHVLPPISHGSSSNLHQQASQQQMQMDQNQQMQQKYPATYLGHHDSRIDDPALHMEQDYRMNFAGQLPNSGIHPSASYPGPTPAHVHPDQAPQMNIQHPFPAHQQFQQGGQVQYSNMQGQGQQMQSMPSYDQQFSGMHHQESFQKGQQMGTEFERPADNGYLQIYNNVERANSQLSAVYADH